MAPPHSPHKISLLNTKPFYSSPLGSIQKITSPDLPILKNLSIKRLVLAPRSIREPHWHANANELAYCLAGSALISILDSGNAFSHFTIDAGEMFHITSGSLHCIENVGDGDAEFIIAFRHENPEDFSLSAGFGAMSDAVLGNTYDLEAAKFAAMKRDMSTQPKYIVKRDGKLESEIPSSAKFPNSHKFNIEGQIAPTQAAGVGSAKKASSMFWPALDNMAMYSLRVEEEAMREPHWHPETVEMGYVHQGEARMTIMDPDGSLDTYYLKPGDCYFIPAAYPHQIEVVGSEEIHFIIFFDQPMPRDIGYRTSASALSREVLAASFGIDESQLPVFPGTVYDPLLVGKVNPIDPVPKSKL